MRHRIVLGSRGSELALAQARLVEEALRRVWPDLEIALEIIRTSGDESAPVVDRKAGRKGIFTREIEKALLVRQIDLAVHSAKDLPSEGMEELEVRATLPRANTEDVLVTKNGARLTTMPSGALLGAGSVRRQHQLRWKRPDLQIADLRGNVPTRLRKLRENENWSGIILARAGLERLGLFRGHPEPSEEPVLSLSKESPFIQIAMEVLSPIDFVPAGGQGVIALQIRREDEAMQRLLDAVNHETTFLCLRAEREFLRLLQGDCDSPVGVHAELENGKLTMRAQVFEKSSAAPRIGDISGALSEPEVLAATLLEAMSGS